MTLLEKSQPCTDCEKCEGDFGHHGRQLREKQNQLESVVAEKKNLEDLITRQCESSECDVRLYDQLVSQMKRELLMKDLVEEKAKAKKELAMSFVNAEFVCLKLKLEISELECADYKARLDDLYPRCPNSKEFDDLRAHHSHELSNPGETSEGKTMGDDLERNFIWKQYEMLDAELTNKLDAQKAEFEKEKEQMHSVFAIKEQQLQSDINIKDDVISSLLSEIAEFKSTVGHLEAKNNMNKQLQSNINNKDAIISSLMTANAEFKTTVGRLESKNKKNENIIQALESELQEMKMKKASDISKKKMSPVRRHCLTAPRNSTKSGSGALILAVKKEIGDSQKPGKHGKNLKRGILEGVGSSKRKAKEVNLISSEIPKLFSSKLKIPKLKKSRS